MSDAVDRDDVILATLQAANQALASADRATRRLTALVRLLVAKGVISEAELEQVVQEVDAQVEVDLALSRPPLTDALEKLRRWREQGAQPRWRTAVKSESCEPHFRGDHRPELPGRGHQEAGDDPSRSRGTLTTGGEEST